LNCFHICYKLFS